MAWQRKIPFGYLIQNGEAVQHPDEGKAVRNIFSQYLLGESYSRIAAEMERQGVRYHQHTPQWNKHMVKRILENPKYLGGDGYPRMVTDEDFLAVQLRREKQTTYAPCPEELAPVRGKVVCMVCGAKMTRDTKSKGRPRWHCQNPECRQSLYIGDGELLSQVRKQIRLLALTAVRAKAPAPAAPSLDAIRIGNELNLCFNRADINHDYIKTLIFAAAAERYSEIPDSGPPHRLEELIRQVRDNPEDEEALWAFFDAAVDKVRVGRGGIELAPVSALEMKRREEQAV